MLGVAPLAGMPLAGTMFPFGLTTSGSSAWRRLLSQRNVDAVRNRQAPFEMVWHDSIEEEEAMLLEIMRTM